MVRAAAIASFGYAQEIQGQLALCSQVVTHLLLQVKESGKNARSY